MAPRGPSPLIAEARKRWNRCNDAEQAQRDRILQAKQFRSGDQWPAAIKSARAAAGGISGRPPQPARPCLVVDRLSQPVRQISNTIKNADFGFDVMPNGGESDSQTADIFKGYMRWVQNRARGESPVEWAADGAIEGGIGWFRLRTEFVHHTWDGDPNDPALFDQEIRLERITNNLTVYCDPSAMRPTRSDAQYMFVTEDLDRDEFKVLYPHADLKGLEEFEATGDRTGWVSQDTIRIAEYWRIEYTDRTFYELLDGTVQEGGDEPDEAQIRRTRVMRMPVVKCDTINAVESLKSWEWAGSRIPIIPILGEELNVDGTPVLRGIISEGMDAQRMVNYTYSGAMEIFALAPKSPYIAAAGQIEPYKALWDAANTFNFSYLPYEPQDLNGRPLPPPQRQTYEAPIQAAVELMRTSEEAIKATTSTGDASLGNSHPNERSGRALQSLQAQSDLANSNYPDNVRRALIYAAEQIVEVAPKITRRGQIIQILGQDDEPKQVMVGQPYQDGPDGKGGPPMPAPMHVTPELAKQPDNFFKFYDLNNGKYSVTVTVGKANATRREEGAAALGELIPHLPPEMAAVATPDYVEQLSFPGSHKIAEKLRKALPPQLQDQDQNSQMPPQLQAMVGQLQQQLQQAQQIIQTDQVKQQATIQTAQAEIASKERIAQAELAAKVQMAQIASADKAADREAKLAVAELSAKMDRLALFLEERARIGAQMSEQASTQQAQQHEIGMAGLAQQHEAEMASQAAQQAAQGQNGSGA